MNHYDRIHIKGTSKTPEIDFKPGMISISGRSIPEDTIAFYKPILGWVENYVSRPEATTEVNFKIEYINSGSNRFLYSILKLLEDSYSNGNGLVVNWFYEDDDDIIKNLGYDFKSLFKIPINLVELN